MDNELLERLKTLADELYDISQSHDSGYSTYNRQHAEERGEMAWRRLRELAEEAKSLAYDADASYQLNTAGL